MIWLVTFAAFASASLLVVAGYYFFVFPSGQLTDRLQQISRQASGTMTSGVETGREEFSVRVFRILGLLLNFKPRADGVLIRRLHQAGFYGENAALTYSATRLLLAVGLPLLATIIVSLMGTVVLRFIILFPVLALIGYSVPAIWLSSRISRRKLLLRHGLADACDLMVACVEAGLSLNAALVRVSTELGEAHPDISKEFELTGLEIRAGKRRDEALRNLGVRTDVRDLKSLAAMLIQTDKFGTSIARALRVFCDTLRTKRRQRAEEAAAKTTIKLVFPLVLFIFPAILLVLLGPGVIRLMDTFSQINR